MSTMLEDLKVQLRAELRAELEPELRAELEPKIRVEIAKFFQEVDQRRSIASERTLTEARARLDFAARKAERETEAAEQELKSKRAGNPYHLWSTHRYEEGQHLQGTDRRLFTTPLGCVGQGFARPLSIAETNLRESGRIAAGSSFGVRAVEVELWGSERDADMFRANCVVRMDMLQEMIDLFPMSAPNWKREAAFDERGFAVLNENGQRATKSFTYAVADADVALKVNTVFSIILSMGTGLAEFDPDVRCKRDLAVRVTLMGKLRSAGRIRMPNDDDFEEA